LKRDSSAIVQIVGKIPRLSKKLVDTLYLENGQTAKAKSNIKKESGVNPIRIRIS
jgi:hypothetical protein